MNTLTQVGEQRAFYNRAYQAHNYFDYGERLYRPYVRSLIALSRLKKGACILDAGCGQGFFSHLFATEGMVVLGTDLSIVGLGMAKSAYGHEGVKLFASDLSRLPLADRVDCVFIRSCSIFNTPALHDTTEYLARLVGIIKPGGVMIFVYNTNLSGGGDGWRHHSMDEIRRCLDGCVADVRLYLVNKIDVLLLRKGAFNRIVTTVNEFALRRAGLGGEVVGICRVEG